MPLDRFVLILVVVLLGALVTVWLGAWIAASIAMPVGWALVAPVAALAYVVWRVVADRLAARRSRSLRPDGPVIVCTTDGVAGREVIAVLGLARGSTVRAKHIGSDIVAGLRNLVGGEVKEYAALLTGAREQAIDRMTAQARTMGADAVVGVRLETSTITQAASEVLAYGTAVRLR